MNLDSVVYEPVSRRHAVAQLGLSPPKLIAQPAVCCVCFVQSGSATLPFACRGQLFLYDMLTCFAVTRCTVRTGGGVPWGTPLSTLWEPPARFLNASDRCDRIVMADARAPASAAPPGLPVGQIDERTVHRLRDGTSYVSSGLPGADNRPCRGVQALSLIHI